MDQEKVLVFKQQLEAMKGGIIDDVEQTLHRIAFPSGNIPDPNDRASQESDRGFELRIRDRERKLLDKIDEALERIKEDEYGICAECGEDIAEKRLEARPVAKFCIGCKKKQEQQEKSRGS